MLIAAHGNSLRALVKYLDDISDQDIVELNIPTGIPLVYELDAELKPLGSRYLGDPEAAKKAAEAVRRSRAKASINPQRTQKPQLTNLEKPLFCVLGVLCGPSGGPIGLFDLGVVCGNPKRA